MLAALDSAEATGGDWRGRGGAAVLVVPASGSPWERVIDLRVEEGDDSLVELRRLVTRAEAYRAANRAERDQAGVARAGGLPDAHVRWLAFLDAARAGDVEAARRLLHERKGATPVPRPGASVRGTTELPALDEIPAE